MSLYKKPQICKYTKFVQKYQNTLNIDFPHLSTLLQTRLDSPDPVYAATNPPIYLSSKFIQYTPGTATNNHVYERYSNPTVSVLNDIMAKLDFAKYSLSTSSGSAAFTVLMHLFKPDDEVLVTSETYTGGRHILDLLFRPINLNIKLMDYENLAEIENNITEKTKALFLETPTNPTMKTYDIQAISKICKKHNILLIVDNTTATQVCTSPMLLGADITWYACSKYINGHADCLAGSIVLNNKNIYDKLFYIIGTCGYALSPFVAHQVLRSLHTLKLRMHQHITNSIIVSNFLQEHPGIKKVYHTGLKDYKYKEIADKQMRAPCAMMSFEIKGNDNEVDNFIQKLKLVKFAACFGGQKSTLNQSYKQSHKMMSKQEKLKEGITKNFFRFSVGLEEPADILQDLDRALTQKK